MGMAVTAIEQARLSELISHQYGLSINRLEDLPLGMVGKHFRLETSTGEQYFITLYDQARLARIAANRLDFTLALTNQLFQSGCFNNLVPPQATRWGALKTYFDGDCPLVVYPYIEGRLLADEIPLSAETWAELGELVARLHTVAGVAEKLPHPIVEQFDVHFEVALRKSLCELKDFEGFDREAQWELRDLVLPQAEKINGFLRRLHDLGEALGASPPPFVICHSDIHPWNVIRACDQRLVLIDWEGARLAPPEQDLFIFLGEGFISFLQAYFRAGGKRALSVQAFVFYLIRRNLEDLTDYFVRILHENQAAESDRSDLDGVHALIADWVPLETAEQDIRAILAEV